MSVDGYLSDTQNIKGCILKRWMTPFWSNKYDLPCTAWGFFFVCEILKPHYGNFF